MDERGRSLGPEASKSSTEQEKAERITAYRADIEKATEQVLAILASKDAKDQLNDDRSLLHTYINNLAKPRLALLLAKDRTEDLSDAEEAELDHLEYNEFDNEQEDLNRDRILDLEDKAHEEGLVEQEKADWAEHHSTTTEGMAVELEGLGLEDSVSYARNERKQLEKKSRLRALTPAELSEWEIRKNLDLDQPALANIEVKRLYGQELTAEEQQNREIFLAQRAYLLAARTRINQAIETVKSRSRQNLA